MFDHLRILVLAIWAAISPLTLRAPDAGGIADAIAAAVTADALPPITGTKEGDAALAAAYVFWESGIQKCGKRGDGGRAVGAFQLQGVKSAIACDANAATALWLAWARASFTACADRPLDERMSQLASGSCAAGHALVRWRWSEWQRLLGRANGDAQQAQR